MNNPKAPMGICRQHVQDFLEENFELSVFQVTEMPLVPGGVILKDTNSETMLVYWDIVNQQIITEDVIVPH